jgi:hypothetical protein
MTGIPVAPGELVDVGYLNEVARAHYRKTTSKQVLNSVVETDLLNGEITIGAGAMSTNRILRLTARGDWTNNSAAARDVPRFKVKLGATTLLDTSITGALVVGAGAFREPWRMDITIANLGATGSQWVQMNGAIAFVSAGVFGAAAFVTGNGTTTTLAGAAAAERNASYEGSNTTAVDTTIAQLLALTVINPTATATCDVTLAHAFVEIV